MRLSRFDGRLLSVVATASLVAFGLVGCNDDTGPNQPPTVSISSPQDGASIEGGTEISFQGSAEDPEDGPLTGASLVWESSADGQIGTGGTVTTSNLSIGEHTITLTATDSEGATGQASITITILDPNEPPTAEITSPEDGATFSEGEEITFEGSGQDEEDGELGGDALVWESSIDGEIGTGAMFSRSDLSSGEHDITLTATDSEGATGTATVSIGIEGPPQVEITSPSDGAVFDAGVEISFEGSAEDPLNGPITGDDLVWESSVDGQIGTGGTFGRSDLTIGAHTITLTATDADGNTGSASVDITVNATPTVTIDNPADGAVVALGTDVTFEATAQDQEDGELTGDAVAWESDVDGELGTGASLTVSDLSEGEHTITVTATDSDGGTATASIQISVERLPAEVEVSPGFLLFNTTGSASITVEVFDGEGNMIQDATLEVASEDMAVATVSDGEVQAQGAGVTDVVATATINGVSGFSRAAVVGQEGFAVRFSNVEDDIEMAASSGSSLEVPLRIEQSEGGSGTIGSIEGTLTWDPNKVTFEEELQDSRASGWTVIVNENDVANGELRFSAFTTSTQDTGFELMKVVFSASGDAGTRAALDLEITAAGDEVGNDITDQIQTVDTAVEVEQ